MAIKLVLIFRSKNQRIQAIIYSNTLILKLYLNYFKEVTLNPQIKCNTRVRMVLCTQFWGTQVNKCLKC